MSFWNETITIGTKAFPRFMAAPLDGITDSPMRVMIRKFSSSELLFTEMRHVACVVNSKQDHSLRFKQLERPLAFQFSANNIQFIDQAVERVIACGIDMINLNIGCPARNVIKSGSGCALMADLPRLTLLVKQFLAAIDNRIPFTIKMRAGFKEKNALIVAQLLEGLGVPALIIHPRTQPEMFNGLPDVELVAHVKKAVKIPIIFSGNINTFARAQKMYEQTGCDGFMIGRALWGAPWKMHEMAQAAEAQKFSVDSKQALTLAYEHLLFSMEHYGPAGYQCFKKHLPVYIRSIPNAAETRKHLLEAQTFEEIKDILLKLCN